jgi:alanine racemase
MMTFTLSVDATVFRKHLHATANNFAVAGSSITPVIKGNGYGFGREILAQESASLGVQKICVGTIWEVESVAEIFPGLIHVLEPITTVDAVATSQWREILTKYGDRVLATINSVDTSGLVELGVQHVVIECLTSLHRFGLSPHNVQAALSNLSSEIKVNGFNIHLPIAEPTKNSFAFTPVQEFRDHNSRLQEVLGWINWLRDIVATTQADLAVSISHITPDEVQKIKTNASDVMLDVRSGTQLWLGAIGALKVTGTVLEVHDVQATTHVGYSQTSGKGKLIVVSGGTSHGVALSAPATTRSLRKRGIAIAEGFSQALGKVRSPFISRGKNLQFAEPPHMHVSMLWCDDHEIKVGDQLLCNVRNTTAHFDVVVGLEK